MPVYIRKNLSFTPTSIQNVQLEDDNDFLLDPDQLKDVLPQPYRMINKLLVQMLDNVWEICEVKENAILAEARKIRPPRLEEPDELEHLNQATALNESADGKYIFVGLPNGLAAIDTFTQKPVASWEDSATEVISIKSYLIAPGWHAILTLDDMAVSRIFLFAFNNIFSIKVLNESAAMHAQRWKTTVTQRLTIEAQTRNHCLKFEAANDLNYAGIVLENSGTREVWLEIYKLPVEAWLKELEAISISKKPKEDEKAPHETEQAEAVKIAESNDKAKLSVGSVPELGGIKFSMPTLILKVKPPSRLPLAASPHPNFAIAMSKIDSGDVLGVGTQHIMTSAHIDARDLMFKHKHEDMMRYLPTDREENIPPATFHFVNASRMSPLGLDSNQSEKKTMAVLVWWPGSPHLSQYSLLRGGKGIQTEFSRTDVTSELNKDIDIKPDIVWPFTSLITCSAVSPCSSHVAIGLKNGNLVLWNRHLGIDKAVLSVSEKSSLQSIRFLDPCLFPMEVPHSPPYPTTSATYLLTECADGSQALFDTCDGSQQIPRQLTTKPDNDDDFQTLLKVIPSLPELILYVQKNGRLYIKDIGTGAAICEIGIPSTHTLQSPWEPVFAFGDGGNFLFLKAEGTWESEEAEDSVRKSLFMYNLKSYKELEPYWAREYEKKELNVFSNLENRINILMTERLQQQALRKPRMQNRWGQLRSELSMIQQAQEIPVQTMKISVPSSIRSSVEIIEFNETKAAVF